MARLVLVYFSEFIKEIKFNEPLPNQLKSVYS